MNRSRLISSLCLLLGLLCASWTATASGQERAENRFVGVVTQDNAEVRAGGGNTYYVVGHLDRDTRVQVVDNHFGWYRVVAPLSIHSQIAKDAVHRHDDGEHATVVVDSVKVRTENLSDPGDSWRVQTSLGEGDRVRVVGEWGDSYRIEPPEDAHVYISPALIRRSGDQSPVVRAAPPESPSEEPVEERPTPRRADPQTPGTGVEAVAEVAEETPRVEVEPDPEPVVAGDPVVIVPPMPDVRTPSGAEPEEGGVEEAVPDPAVVAVVGTPFGAEDEPVVRVGTGQGPDESDMVDATPIVSGSDPEEAPVVDSVRVEAEMPEDWEPTSADVREVEARYRDKFELPLEEQPLDEMQAAYEKLLNTPGHDESTSTFLANRLAAIERNRRLKAALVELDDVRERVESAQAEEAAAEASQEDAPAATGDGGEPVRYDAVGRLLASGVYNGQSRPKLYRLVDPSLGRTVAYIQPLPGGQLDGLEGELVGIVGKATYDAGLRLQVYAPVRADALGQSAE